MEHQEQEFYALDESKQSRYHKRFIFKIVEKVENGTPRKEVIRIHVWQRPL